MAAAPQAIAPPVATQPINTVSLTEQSDGKLLLRFRQAPGGAEYIIESIDDLNKTAWQTLLNVQAGVDGIVELLIDPAANKQTFYRALVL